MTRQGARPLNDGRVTRNIATRITPTACEVIEALAHAENISRAKYVGRVLEAHAAQMTDETNGEAE